MTRREGRKLEQAKKTILVVDDEPDVRDYLQAVLEDSGFEVVTASDGVEALEKMRAARPDLISLDLVMPRKTGNKLIYEMKKDKALSKIPVIVVTAHAQDELGKRDLNDLLENRMISGPGTYLEKPVNALTYVRSIRRALGMPEENGLEERLDLKEELRKRMESASPEALKKALEALARGRK